MKAVVKEMAEAARNVRSFMVVQEGSLLDADRYTDLWEILWARGRRQLTKRLMARGTPGDRSVLSEQGRRAFSALLGNAVQVRGVARL